MLLAINACPIMHEPGIRPPKPRLALTRYGHCNVSPPRGSHPCAMLRFASPLSVRAGLLRRGKGYAFRNSMRNTVPRPTSELFTKILPL